MRATRVRKYGVHFRSRLECEAADVLERHKLVWVYEPKSFDLGNGETYTPDLWVPRYAAFVEVKATGGVERLHKPWILGRTLQLSGAASQLLVWQDRYAWWAPTSLGWRLDFMWPARARRGPRGGRRWDPRSRDNPVLAWRPTAADVEAVNVATRGRSA